jgi:OOP family OmpA-OmpF porin
MKNMISTVVVLAAALTLSTQAMAHEGLELGVGLGTTHALTPDDFKRAAKTGEANLYWLGYGFDKNWAAELSYDSFDFDGADTKHQTLSASAVYTFFADSMIHPIAKLGLGTTESKDVLDEKQNSLSGKAAVGIEGDFKYVSVGALFNYIYIQKAQSSPDIENASALIPAVYLTIHGAREYDHASKSEAPKAAVAAPAAKVDTDGDGVNDGEDKCPSTKSGIEVNGYGCSLTEKASIKLQVEFANGKSVLDPKFDGEIKTLADFMVKYPNTNVEIAGHSDSTGQLAANNALSQKRADAVKAALIKAGVDAKRVSAKGYGASQPIADNKTAEGRQANRRVMADVSVVAEKKK